MAVTHIAFIDCSMKKHWFPRHEAPDFNPANNNEYKAYNEDAEIYLVDLKGDRRNFFFKKMSKVHIVGNVLVFESSECDELSASDEKGKIDV